MALCVKSNRATPNGQNRAQEFEPRRETVRLFRILLIVAAGASGPSGTRAYVDCRRALVEAREQQKAIIQEQKRRDFDRILGEGTGGFDESF
jgi:hypothetical protein